MGGFRVVEPWVLRLDTIQSAVERCGLHSDFGYEVSRDVSRKGGGVVRFGVGEEVAVDKGCHGLLVHGEELVVFVEGEVSWA